MSNDFVVISKYPALFKQIERALILDADNYSDWSVEVFRQHWAALIHEIELFEAEISTVTDVQKIAFAFIASLIELMAVDTKNHYALPAAQPITQPKFSVGEVVRHKDTTVHCAWRISSITEINAPHGTTSGKRRYYGHHLVTGLMQAAYEHELVLSEPLPVYSRL